MSSSIEAAKHARAIYNLLNGRNKSLYDLGDGRSLHVVAFPNRLEISIFQSNNQGTESSQVVTKSIGIGLNDSPSYFYSVGSGQPREFRGEESLLRYKQFLRFVRRTVQLQD